LTNHSGQKILVAMKIEFYGETDLGQVRQINEDGFALLPAAHLVAVCDGMGGHAAGEVASREALRVLAAYFAGQPERFAGRLAYRAEEVHPASARHLVRAIRLASRRVFNLAQQSESSRGMGTTLVSLCFEDGLVAIGHVGDSRAYRLRNRKLERLTIDHSLVAELLARNELTEEESRSFAERNVITRALGTRAGVDVDVRIDTTAAGDIYLLCSDGLCGFVEDHDIEHILDGAKGNLALAAKNLIRAANEVGGEDNITVALARVENLGKRSAAAAQEAATVADADGASGEVADAVLEELLQSQPKDDDDTQKISKLDSSLPQQTPAPHSGGPGRPGWLMWLAVMAAITLFVYLGGINLFR